MHLAPVRTTSHSMTTVFELLKNNQPLPSDMCLLELYYFCKAHKLVAHDHFIKYWNDGKSKQPLRDILKAYYPPLDYGHELKDGFVGLTVYVEFAKQAFGV